MIWIYSREIWRSCFKWKEEMAWLNRERKSHMEIRSPAGANFSPWNCEEEEEKLIYVVGPQTRQARATDYGACIAIYYGDGSGRGSLVLSAVSASTGDGGTFSPLDAHSSLPLSSHPFYPCNLLVESLRQIFSLHLISMNDSAILVTAVCWDMTCLVHKWDPERN